MADLMLSSIYDALKEAGASEESARRAAQSVAARDDVATKTDLKATEADLKIELGQLEARLIRWQFAQFAALALLILGQYFL